MKTTYSITVKGKEKTWSFSFTGEPEHLKDWQADGLDVNEVYNRIPVSAQRLGLTHIWFWFQDAWKFLRFW